VSRKPTTVLNLHHQVISEMELGFRIPQAIVMLVHRQNAENNKNNYQIGKYHVSYHQRYNWIYQLSIEMKHTPILIR